MPPASIAVVDFRFEAPLAEARASKFGARLVTRITEETRAALRDVVATAIREGQPPFEAARAIRALVGMTRPQAKSAMTLRQRLINEGMPLERVDRMVDRYAKRKIRDRAKTIARTETMWALNAGQADALRQAQDKGLLPTGARKRWVTTPDDRLCPICAPRGGQTAAVTTDSKNTRPGSFGDDLLWPPAHPMCRCTIVLDT
jgi:hypothetical protein